MRATNEEVKEIISTDLTAEQIAPFLRAANKMVDALLIEQGYSAGLLMEIECWLAAHFVAIRDPQITKEKIGDAEATYQGKFGEGLRGTSYGQQVLILDHKGTFAELADSKGPVELKVIT